MSPRFFLFAAIAAALAVLLAGAALLLTGDDAPVTVAATPGGDAPGSAPFAALAERANDLILVRLTRGGETVTLERTAGGAWVLREAENYPVRTDAVRTLITGLAGLTLVEAKTSVPARLSALDLGAAAPGSEATQIRAEAGGGAVIADALLGRRGYNVAGPGPAIYLRRADQTQSWLARGDVEVPGSQIDWFDRTILTVPPDAISRLEWRDGDRIVLTATRPEGGTGLTPAPLPAGASPDAARVAQLPSLFSQVAFEGVRPADQVGVPEDGRVVTATLADGRTLTARLAILNNETWVLFTPGGAAAPDAAPLGARLEGWAYRLPAGKLELLSAGPETFVAPPPAPETPVPTP